MRERDRFFDNPKVKGLLMPIESYQQAIMILHDVLAFFEESTTELGGAEIVVAELCDKIKKAAEI